MSHLLIVCYDISNDRDRHAIVKKLQSRGERMQKSIFALHIEQFSEWDEVMAEIAPHIQEPGDTVRYYHLCPKDRQEILHDGSAPSEEEPDFVVL